MRNVKGKIKQSFIIIFTASMVISFCFQSVYSEELATLNDNSNKSVEATTSNNTSQSEFNASEPEESTTSSTSKWLLYGGIAAAGVGILAVAIASTGGDSDDSSNSLVSDVPPVGPSIAGNDWAGMLSIRQNSKRGKQGVTAVITQVANAVTIATSSTLAYGQYFSGKINSGGYIRVLDNATNQTWTTHRGNSSTHSIQLYDIVNNPIEYDTLFMAR